MSDENKENNRRGHLPLEVNKLDQEKKTSLLVRVLVALAILAVIIPPIVLGGYVFFGLIFVASILAIYESIHAPRKKYKWYVWAIVYICAISFIYWSFVKWNVSSYLADKEHFIFSLENNFKAISISVYGIAVELGLLFFCAVAHEDFSMADIAYLFTMSVLMGIGMQSLLFARYYPFNTFAAAGYDVTTTSFKYWGSLVFFFYVEFTCVMTDTWAYFVGVFFGKHKMNPRVSPKKTWEGFFGGCILGGLSGLAFAMINDANGFPLLPSMVIFGPNSHWWWAVIFSFTLPVIGTLGDLSFSFIKRHFGIKDFGFIFAAHGGMLDRVDSVFFCTIFASVLAIFVDGGWNLFS